MQEIAIGKLGMSPDVFWGMTPREFFNAQRGFLEIKQSRKRESWEVARWQAVQLINVHLKKGSKFTKVTDLAVFEWEKEAFEQETRVTEADKARIAAKFGKKIKQKRGSL